MHSTTQTKPAHPGIHLSPQEMPLLTLEDILALRGNFIGAFVTAQSGATIDVENPATGARIAVLAASGAADVATAVSAARASFEEGVWSRADPSFRGRTLWALAMLVRDNAEALSRAEVLDTGKPIAEARLDIIATADGLEFYAGAATKVFGQTMPLPGSQMGVIIREPSGVVGLITPWNFPALLAIAWKAAPALCCGNSVVIKPSELTSLTALAIAHLGVRAGLPAGVLNVITGSGADAGAALANHPGVDVLAFTGGPVTGRKVLRARAELLRPALLELGGKSPNIVFADADLAQAVAGAAFGIYYNQGENCNAGSRVLVHEDVYDAFLAGLEVAAKRIRVLPPLDEACAKWVPSSPQPTWRRWRRTWRSASRRARGSSRAVSVPLALALRAAIFSRPPCLQMCCPATVSSRRRYSGPS